jgi:biopolymer transport protein ExbD
MRLPEETEIPFNINIVSMIDVVFSILTYFIFSSLVLARSQGLDVSLPKASTAQVQQTEQINITIKPDGAIALNREPIGLEQLQPLVQQMVKPNTESMVVVNADEKVDHGIVVAVMDRIRQIKGVKLAIAAKKP